MKGGAAAGRAERPADNAGAAGPPSHLCAAPPSRRAAVAPAAGGASRAPDEAALAELATMLGVRRLQASAPWGSSVGRVWRLQAPETGEAWYWKGRPHPRELFLLEFLGGTARVPAVAACLPRRPSEPPPAAAGVAAACLTEVAGITLARALHAGVAIPVDAWGRAMAVVHGPCAAARRLEAWADVPQRLPDPLTDVGERLSRWAETARRVQTADAQAIIGQTLGALAGLGARAAAEWRPDEAILCHGAWSPDHLLLDHGEISGTVDWEHARLGPPGYDLATAVLGLFQSGVSARAALALGDALAAAYVAASGRQVRLTAFYLVLGAAERLMEAVGLRAARRGGADVQAWTGLLGMCLARASV